MVLRTGSAEVSRPFELHVDHPTPRYVLVASGSSVAIGRLRDVRSEHVDKLRTLWMDANLLELMQFEELTALARQVRRLSETGNAKDWREVSERFRRYRSRELWAASTDHALEAGIAERLRRELKIEQLSSRIQRELDDHNAAAQTQAAERLNEVILVLTLAATLIPLLTDVGTGHLDAFSVAAMIIGVSVLTYVVWRLATGRAV